jgi:glycosyltransferase involved in cell wall biosynthesis
MMPLPIYKMNNPLFSIIIPTYNRAERNAKTVQSALNQTIGDFELIIVDDGSTDNTEEIIKSLLDPRIHYFKKNNEERAIARNYGIHRAKGDYITFLDSDDQLFPHFLDEAQKVIEQNNRPEWFHLAYEIVDEKGVIIRQENKRKGDINKSLIRGNHLSCIGVFIRKDILEKYQFNDDPEIIGSEDYLLWLKLASLYPLRYSNNISACMIQHDGRSVINFNKQQLIRRIEKSIYYATNDPSISNFLKGHISKVKAHRYLYLANHLSRAKYKLSSVVYFFRSVVNFSLILFHRNSLSYLKSLFIL